MASFDDDADAAGGSNDEFDNEDDEMEDVNDADQDQDQDQGQDDEGGDDDEDEDNEDNEGAEWQDFVPILKIYQKNLANHQEDLIQFFALSDPNFRCEMQKGHSPNLVLFQLIAIKMFSGTCH